MSQVVALDAARGHQLDVVHRAVPMGPSANLEMVSAVDQQTDLDKVVDHRVDVRYREGGGDALQLATRAEWTFRAQEAQARCRACHSLS